MSFWKNSTDLNNKFEVNYVNYPLTDDLKSDETPIVFIKDFKNYFNNFLVDSVDQLTHIRKIKFTKSGVFGTIDLSSENFDIPINLLKSNFFIRKFKFWEFK